jgi:hypothetical protein
MPSRAGNRYRAIVVVADLSVTAHDHIEASMRWVDRRSRCPSIGTFTALFQNSLLSDGVLCRGDHGFAHL